MPTLLACLSTGKGTWTEVTKLVTNRDWTNIFLITNTFGKEKFTSSPNTELILVDSSEELPVLIENIKKQLRGRINDFEIALNLISGSGKEHMALLEAVLELGLNFRLITFHQDRVETLGLER